jgi:carotenoid cleavage dioxygenase-like enzyme
VTGELHAVAYYWEWPYVQYIVVGVDGRVRKMVDVPVADSPMMHDMALTESQAVLFDMPVTFNLDAAMAGERFPYRWNPDHGARVGLLPREGTGDDVRWCDVELCYVYHPLNAYDLPDGRVVVDVVRHPSTFHTNLQGPDEGAMTLERWTVDPSSGKVLEERLDDRGQEFPRIDERRLGRPHRFGYTASVAGLAATDRSGGFGPLLKHDLRDGTIEVHDYGPGRGTGEAVFVPSPDGSAEDDGWLMSIVYDAAADASELVILHAQDVTGDPVARVALPQRVPFGFHGNWVADD